MLLGAAAPRDPALKREVEGLWLGVDGLEPAEAEANQEGLNRVVDEMLEKSMEDVAECRRAAADAPEGVEVDGQEVEEREEPLPQRRRLK